MIENLAFSYVCYALFVDLEWKPEPGHEFTLASFMEENKVKRRSKKLMLALLKRLVQKGLLIELGKERFKLLQAPPSETVLEANIKDINTTLSSYPVVLQEMKSTNYCGSHLSSVLCGRETGLNILFPDEKDSLKYPYGAKSLYENSYLMKITKVIPAVEGIIETINFLLNNSNQDTIRILEIGGGTGGTTIPLFNAIKEKNPQLFQRIHYTFTDISNFFIGQTKTHISSLFPELGSNIEFTTLDIENIPTEQGFEANSFDIVLAADVFHATEFLSDTVKHTRSLLKSDGLLVLGEIFQSLVSLELMFGLTGGWWRWGDSIRPQLSPLLSPKEWDYLLKENGFPDSFSVGDGRCGIIFAQADNC